MKIVYVSIGKPLLFHKFDENTAPMGWKRINSLKEKLEKDKEFREKFTKEELKIIQEAN